jgi:hypothetical protein
MADGSTDLNPIRYASARAKQLQAAHDNAAKRRDDLMGHLNGLKDGSPEWCAINALWRIEADVAVLLYHQARRFDEIAKGGTK